MLAWIFQGVLTLFGLRDWLEKRRAKEQGRQEQRIADLEAENATLKKQLEIAVNSPSDDDVIERFNKGTY